MEDKRTIIYPSLLIGILFLLVTLTGYLQIRVIQKNIEGLLISEGEILFKHVKREIDINLEYLDLLDKSSPLITPNFLNLMAYDEAIIEDIYNLLHRLSDKEPDKLPLTNIAVFDKKGETLFRKGTIAVPPGYVSAFLSRKEETFIKMPNSKDRHLLMGVKLKNTLVFSVLNDAELTALRIKFIIKDIIEREEKGFNIEGINIYDQMGTPYLTSKGKKTDIFLLRKPLDSRHLGGHTMEILISKGPADNIFKRTAMSFIVMLLFLVVLGAMSIYVIFLLERRHGRKITELEKEMELKERLVSLGRLASGMAHEIRNPLNAISMSVQRMKREFAPEKDKEEYYQFIDIVRGELLRVDRIVEEFLLSTKSHVPFLSENLYAILEELVILTKEQARIKNITVKNLINQDLALKCQKERLKQALYNLILNGIEAIKGDGSVVLSAETRGRNIDLSIKDSGGGIKKEHLHTIFEYYYTTKDKGMGLGLPISYMIVKDHGGDVKVSSEEGEGTTFVVTLPMDHPVNGEDSYREGEDYKK